MYQGQKLPAPAVWRKLKKGRPEKMVEVSRMTANSQPEGGDKAHQVATTVILSKKTSEGWGR